MGNVTRIERCTGDLELANGTIAGAEQHTSCGGILAGPSLTVTGTGDLTLEAGQRIVLRAGFSVQTGGRLRAGVDPALAAPEVRVYGYQDHQYYLTLADGPWGERDWSYDRIGNRLSETRDRSTAPLQDSYLYEPNATAANTPVLDEILLGVGGVRDYTWGLAGHLAQVLSGGNQVDLTTDPAGRMSRAARSDGTNLFAEATFRYDGRSFLTTAEDPAAGTRVEPTYSSEGLLMGLAEYTGATLDEGHLVFYFGGTPAAHWTTTATSESWQHLTTDHLGTPIRTSNAAGAELWRSTLDPFGNDPDTGTPAGALARKVFLRLPGQWVSEIWNSAVLGTGGLTHNVHRWMEPGTGRYSKADPLGTAGDPHPYVYALSNPVRWSDPLGLQARVCCKPITDAPLLSYFYHCYLEVLDSQGERTTHGLHRTGSGSSGHDIGRYIPNAAFDRREPSGDCGSWTDDCGTDQCVQRESRLYNNPSDYHYLGTNSNTFAGTIARTCGLQPPPIVGPVRTPGWYFPPAPPPVPFNPGRPGYRESPL